MIEASEIEGALVGFLQREVFAPQVALTAETDLLASGFDSMSLVRVLLFIEKTYGLSIPEGEMAGHRVEQCARAGSRRSALAS